MTFKISKRVQEKIAKRGIEPDDIAECFMNRTGRYYSDTRARHQTNPPTYWFVSTNDKGRVLKVVFVRYPDYFAIKSVFEPEDGSDKLYEELESGIN